ncbi:DUF930 domain-containing protein [Devosia psychrophila]|uniref:DUF930 domain-containing protein n=1 Tax=Devosia psychrophila TaxID=728005 RepID=UPI00130EBD3D|nr:DUF930 domain-containing protein [Devosia psychrophila]
MAPIISLVAHCGVLILVFMLWRSDHLQAPPINVIEVQLVAPRPAATPVTPMDEPVPNAEPRMSPEDMAAASTATPAPPPSPDSAPATPTAAATPMEPAAPAMLEATEFYASDLLRRPENAQVRETLPLLAPDERIVQLCNIEALEQIRIANAGRFPDSLDTSAFEETEISNGKLSAPLGAYRAARKWFYVTFECTPGPDLESVVEFTFDLGDEVPRELWEEHELIPEDFDDD